ncbi:VacJ family lipoprotein [Azospirillum sp. SYSU D00513]|uniref:MlaA family lipoprotein n=1 Tax=Azospirillum sp. SYSU D00513 TaxID=2812561 RepID=UPI001A957A66|nr:VacJ family lipoprotein [Azospirillum sp. SYSU D00513]
MTLARYTRPLLRTATAALLAIGVAGCAGTPNAPVGQDVQAGANDPFEPVNRAIFGFNETVDKAVLQPVAEGYVAVVPDPLRVAVHSFIYNLLSPFNIAHNLLQGDLEGAGTATGRFMTNTLLGFGGIADVATAAGIPNDQEDFGQTLGAWGVGEGPFLVLPIIGPSNLRDTFGYAVDTVADPVRLWGNASGNQEWLYGRTGAYAVDRRAGLLREIEDLRRNSIDPYATTRSLYHQQRQAAIRDGRTGGAGAGQQLPDFPEFPQ